MVRLAQQRSQPFDAHILKGSGEVEQRVQAHRWRLHQRPQAMAGATYRSSHKAAARLP
jgi:hypothetical protein